MRISDWSSDVCSSDRRGLLLARQNRGKAPQGRSRLRRLLGMDGTQRPGAAPVRLGQSRAGPQTAARNRVRVVFQPRVANDTAGYSGLLRPQEHPHESEPRLAIEAADILVPRTETNTTELQSLMRNSYAV